MRAPVARCARDEPTAGAGPVGERGAIVMDARSRPLARLAAAAALAAIAALAACTGGEPAPESAPAAGATPAAPTAAPAATPPPSPTAAPPAADPAATGSPARAIERGTTWQEVFDALRAPEQACIRGKLQAGAGTVLARPVLGDGPTEEWEVAVFSCLAPATARAVFLGAVIAGMDEDGIEPRQAELACMREWAAGLDVPALVASLRETDAPAAEITIGFMRCMPDLLVSLMLDGIGADRGDVGEDERACLREWASGVGGDTLLAMTAGDETLAARFALGFLACAPAVLIPIMTGEETELDKAAEECLRELLGGIGVTGIGDRGGVADPLAGDAELYGRLLACIPALAAGSGGDAPSDSDDDHADARGGATPLAVGASAEGALGSVVDADYFVFPATRGALYQIDVTPGTLTDSVAVLYDAEGRELAFSDDHAGSLASRIYWEATYSGPHYIEVWGYDTGAYTVTVVAR